MTDGTDIDDVPMVAASPSNAEGHVLPEFVGRVGFERELLDK